MLASITHLIDARSDPRRALEHALRLGRPIYIYIYIGIVLSSAERTQALGRWSSSTAPWPRSRTTSRRTASCSGTAVSAAGMVIYAGPLHSGDAENGIVTAPAHG